jgi:hypothetical protein
MAEESSTGAKLLRQLTSRSAPTITQPSEPSIEGDFFTCLEHLLALGVEPPASALKSPADDEASSTR